MPDHDGPGAQGFEDAQYASDDAVGKSALISICETFRYYLMRAWDKDLPVLIFIMLNPSTADAFLDDPTIRRCMGFARANGYGGIMVVNLFAYRSPSPKEMKAAADPVGPDNNLWLQKAFEYAAIKGADVIAAWGADGAYRDRDYEVAELAEMMGLTLKCLGHTKDRQPRHPLYVKGDQPFVPLRGEP